MIFRQPDYKILVILPINKLAALSLARCQTVRAHAGTLPAGFSDHAARSDTRMI